MSSIVLLTSEIANWIPATGRPVHSFVKNFGASPVARRLARGRTL